MSGQRRTVSTACQTATLADIVERVLDKGLVISGDIRVKLVDVELLTIQIRLVLCSVDKAKEIGLDWWNREGGLNGRTSSTAEIDELKQRLRVLERQAAAAPPVATP